MKHSLSTLKPDAFVDMNRGIDIKRVCSIHYVKGQMQIFYCEKCGMRIPLDEIGEPHSSPAPKFCRTCAPAKLKPVSKASILVAPLANINTAKARPNIKPKKPAEQTGLIVGFGALAAVILILVVLLIGRGGNTPAPQLNPPEKPAPQIAQVPMPSLPPPPLPSPTSVPYQSPAPPIAAPVALPASAEPAKEPPKPATDALSPREEFELRIKEGKVKREPAPAPEPRAEPPPVIDASGWAALFDGKTLACLDPESIDRWKVENGAIASTNSEYSGAQSRNDFSDGVIRFRFENGTSEELSFEVRQGLGGKYRVAFGKSESAAMAGKTHELVFVCDKAAVSATLDGQPAAVKATAQPAEGRFKFAVDHGSLRVLGIDFQKLPAK